MEIKLLPTLHVQHDLYAMPRDLKRFWHYIDTMTGGTGDVVLPITAANPMGKEHCLAKVDELIAFDAERVAEAAITHALGSGHLEQTEPARTWQLSLILVDDLLGGWTNRTANEFTYRTKRRAQLLKRPFIVVPIWTSEAWDAHKMREATLIEIYRTAYIVCHGDARTLAELLAQEGQALDWAEAVAPALDDEDLIYTRAVIGPHLQATDQPTQLVCLFGDEAARVLGYPPLGLSKQAGLALALHDARRGLKTA